MQLECFRGADFSQVSYRARRALGDDALILHTRTRRDDGVAVVEVLAAAAATLEHARTRLEPAPLPIPLRRPGGRPYIVALVGPTGAGKTTTAAKLAVRPGTFGGGRTGLLTLDTYRVGGLDQLATYADLADVPFDVLYEPREVPDVLARLAACDVLIVDTPGRSPAAADVTDRWRSLLDALAPDEVHLVLPATLRGDLALAAQRAYRATPAHRGASHLVLTKLDEVPALRGVTDLALSLALPARWITDGQDVPAHLAPAAPRLLRALGLGLDADDGWVAP
jgi:flagellar biosynthesis protein FlhF